MFETTSRELPGQRRRVALAASAAITLLGATFGLPAAGHAQQPAPSPPGQLGQPSAQTGPVLLVVKPSPTQTEWSKICGKDPTGKLEACFTTRDFVSDQGQPAMAVAVYDIKGGPEGAARLVRILTPLGMLIQPGIRFVVDDGQPLQGRYSACLATGCFAEVAGLKDETLAQLKRAEKLQITMLTVPGRELTFQVPLSGFGQAFDGPPADPKLIEEQQKKAQEEFQRRSGELRRRVEGDRPGGAPPAGTASPPVAPAPAPARP